MWGTKFFLSHCIGDWPLAYTRACRPYRHSTWYTWVWVSRLLSLTFLLLYFWHGDRPQLFISCLRLPPTVCSSDVLSIWFHVYWYVQRLMQSVLSVRSTCMNRLTPVHAIVDHQTDCSSANSSLSCVHWFTSDPTLPHQPGFTDNCTQCMPHCSS